MGQTYLQKLASLKNASTVKAATKYPTMIQAVHDGRSHRLNASYEIKYVSSNTAASHFDRKKCGQRCFAGNKRLPNSRGSMNGHAMQKTFPTASRPIIKSPRQ